MFDREFLFVSVPLLILMIVFFGLSVRLFVIRRSTANPQILREEDPRQRIMQLLLGAFTLSNVLTLFSNILSGDSYLVTLDITFSTGWLSLFLLNPRMPRLTRSIFIFLVILCIPSFGLPNLFLPSGVIIFAIPIVAAGLLLEAWEMVIFMALLSAAYLYLRGIYRVPEAFGPADFDDVAQVGLIMLGFLATLTSSMLTGAFYRERALRKAQEQMLRTVCHELRTPVAAMRSFWAATRMEGMDVSLGALEPLAEDVQRHTDYLHQLTEQVVQIVRARQTTQAKEWVDLAETARRSVSQMALLAKTKGMNLSLQVSEEPLKIWGTNEWQTVLVNLVDNALRHSHGTQIEVRVERQQGVPVLIVRDDGRGLPLELHLLIQPWVRHDQESSRGVSQGLGLGWTIIQDICQRNQARIQAGQGIDGKGLGVTIAFKAPGLFQPVKQLLRRVFPSGTIG